MESVDGDDDLFVVIVGEEEDSTLDTDKRKQVFEIKQEVLDEEISEVDVEKHIETAEKYGQAIEVEIVKQEPEEYLEYLENQDENLQLQEELLNAKHEFEYDDNDEDYVQESDEYSEEEYLDDRSKRSKKKSDRTKGESQRYKMRTPQEQQSFVQKLYEEYPELKEDPELLVETLGRIMLEIKRPEPPKDYFIMNNVLFECVECGAMSETVPAATRHWQEKHGPRYLICFACGVDFRSTTNLYKHEKRCSAPDAVLVLRARARTLGPKGRSRPFLSDVALRKIKPQMKKKFPCTTCAAVFLSKQSLQSHELKHSGSRPYRCSQCPAAYTSACGLSRHRAKHSDVRFVCDECRRPFRSKAALIVHLDTHKPLRKFPCAECGRRFAQKMALQLHVDREHRHLPPPCACQICPKRYPRMSLLKTHMLKEHGMNLITRKMFYKSLPMLSHTQLQKAKVILKSDIKESEFVRQQMSKIKTEAEDNAEETDLSHELVNFLKGLRNGVTDDGSKYIVIQNGEAVCVDGNNIELYRNNQIAQLEKELEQRLEGDDDLQGRKQILCETSGLVVYGQSTSDSAKVVGT